MTTLAPGGGKPYLAEMAFFPRPVWPSRAVGDLVTYVRTRGRRELMFGLLSVGITLLWFWAIFDKLYPKPEYKAPPVFYAKQWRADRTVAEVRAQQAKDLPAELAAKREREKAEADRRAKFQKLAKQLGL